MRNKENTFISFVITNIPKLLLFYRTTSENSNAKEADF